MKGKVGKRAKRLLIVSAVCGTLLGGIAAPAAAAQLKRYRVVMRDLKGHKGAEEVCAVNPKRAAQKALEKWGHKGHRRTVVWIKKTGECKE